MIFSTLDAYLEHKEAFLDAFIDSNSDHDLFVSSYIHGHFSVEAAKVCSQAQLTLNEAIIYFELLLNSSIASAIANKELNNTDAKDVQAMLANLWAH